MAYGSTYLVVGLLSSPNYKCLRTWKMSAHTRGNLEDFPKKNLEPCGDVEDGLSAAVFVFLRYLNMSVDVDVLRGAGRVLTRPRF